MPKIVKQIDGAISLQITESNNPRTKKSERFKWKLKGLNGEPMAHGEGHSSVRDCLRAVRTIKYGLKSIIIP